MSRKGPPQLSFPTGKHFAFTVFDDCDNSTVGNTRPFYDLLDRLGMRTTKTVWCVDSSDVTPCWQGSSTLEDTEYREFAEKLQSRGFEIAFHGASMMSSRRDKTRRALEIFRETFGQYPRSYANHGNNLENVYWFAARFRSWMLRALYTWVVTRNVLSSKGHVAESPYFWGDLCQEHIEYVRGFTFPVVNLLSIRPSVLFRDPTTPFVNFWFLASHAPNVEAFNTLLQPVRQEALLRQGGICIVATHSAAGFVQNGETNRKTRQLLESLAEKDGWFVPVSTLLDYLRTRGLGQSISHVGRRMMELAWLFYAIRRGTETTKTLAWAQDER